MFFTHVSEVGRVVFFLFGHRLHVEGFFWFTENSQDMVVNSIFVTVVHVNQYIFAVVQETPDERRRRHVFQGQHLHVWVFELNLRQVPEHELSGAPVIFSQRIVMNGEYLYPVFEHDLTSFQILYGSPDRSRAFHERHDLEII